MAPVIYLVACVAAKRSVAAPARDLYTSAWFRKARTVAERDGDRWYVLSALHGLLGPDDSVEPYEYTLAHVSASERRAWSRRVLAELERVLSGTERIVVLAGMRYRRDLVPALRERGHEVGVPLEGLRIGHQLQRLNAWLEAGHGDAGIDPASWLQRQPGWRWVPLFDVQGGVVGTRTAGVERRVLRRSDSMERLVNDTVDEVLTRPDADGLVYAMAWREPLRLLYVGKAGKRGRVHAISANLRNLGRTQTRFARWGDGLAYHVGGLSAAVLGSTSPRRSARKYDRWRERLFRCTNPPILRETVWFGALPWFRGDLGPERRKRDVGDVEADLIALASRTHRATLLNHVGNRS